MARPRFLVRPADRATGDEPSPPRPSAFMNWPRPKEKPFGWMSGLGEIILEARPQPGKLFGLGRMSTQAHFNLKIVGNFASEALARPAYSLIWRASRCAALIDQEGKSRKEPTLLF
jgi:hypothetical protein